MILGPRSKERPADAGATLVGGLDAIAPATVDGAGLVTPARAQWSVDWWVGASDRWYFPSREATVRQRRHGFGPVIETAVRVPDGDITHTVYPVVGNDGDLTVIEVANDTKVPVAVAMVIRPYRADGITTSAEINLEPDLGVGSGSIEVDGRIGLVLPRPPAAQAASSTFDLAQILIDADPTRPGNDPFMVSSTPVESAVSSTPVESAGSSTPGGASASASGHDANAVMVFPLPHGTSLRFVVPAVGSEAPPPDSSTLAALPGPASAARGWDSVIEAAGRFQFPDEAVTNLANAARSRLLFADCAPSDPIRPTQYGPILAAFAAGGHDAEARRWLVALARSFPTSIPDPAAAADLLSGVGLAAATADEPELTEALLEPCAQLAYLIERAKADPVTVTRALDGLARLLVVAGQPDSVADIVARLARLSGGVGSVADDLAGLNGLNGQAEAAGPAGRFGLDDDANLAARYWISARSLLVSEPISDPDAGPGSTIDLVPSFPTAWRGGNLEVHGAATLYGLVSFAIRWHGARPALLWDFQPHPNRAGSQAGSQSQSSVRLRCPGLDPDWSTTEPRGETLLSGSAESLPAPPGEGEGFQ